MRNAIIQPRSAQLRTARQLAVALAATAGAMLLWFASGLLVPAALVSLSARLHGLVTIFLGIFIEALPFLLAGVLASSVLHLFVSDAQVRRLSPRSPLLAALTGSLLGLAFPVCECGSVPATRRLLSKGAPLPLGIAFVLAAPVVNPVVIAGTWVAFGGRLDIVAGRIGLTVLIAMAIGLIVGMHPRPHELLAPFDKGHDHDHDHDHTECLSKNLLDEGRRTKDERPALVVRRSSFVELKLGRLRMVLEHASGEFFEMGRYLIIGALIAATLQTVVPQAMLLDLGQGPVISALVLMALAVVLSICSTVDAFVALAFAGSFMPGALLAFLVFGPMVDVKSVLMLSSTFRRRTVALIVLLAFQMVLLAAVVINIYF